MLRRILLPPPAGRKNVAGCDEAGRGCLAGPVFAAAVILPDTVSPELTERLDDSKVLTAAGRDYLRPLIERESIAFSVAMVDNLEIDRINILQASIRAMHLALKGLGVQPNHIMVDGNRFIPFESIPFQCVVKGDATYLCIAAASVLAKTYRDVFMLEQHVVYPEYGWNANKGYPTKRHREALAAHGLSPLHRRSFKSGTQTSLSL